MTYPEFLIGAEIHPLTETHVNKVIANLEKVGREVHPAAREVGKRMIESGAKYPTATEAVNNFKTVIWNRGMVR